MSILILSPRFTEDSRQLAGAAVMAGWRVERLMNWRADERWGDVACAVYGEPLFAAAVSEQISHALIEPTFDWLTTLPAAYLGRGVRFLTLAEARAVTGPTFFKPADDKCFPARVYAGGHELPGTAAGLADETPILAAEPVRWGLEVRNFVFERSVQTASPYSDDGIFVDIPPGDGPERVPAEATAFLDRFLADESVALPPAVVVDVGFLSGHGWAVVEANAAWGSGIYGCEPERVLPVLARACRPSGGLADGDRRWVLNR